MMARHSPSSSGSSSSRRLSELLGEQQEPFYLDLYLLEKGCRSPAFLDAAACGGGAGACSTCWPRARRSIGRRMLRRPSARSKKPPRGSGVLRLLLSKILSGASARAPTATAAAKKTRLQPAAIDWRSRSVDDEKQRTPGDSESASVPSLRAVESQQMEDDEEPEEEDEEEDESLKKQLSPVSVLEQRLFEQSPPPPHAQKGFVLFSDLLEAAYAPTTLLSLLANARKYSSGVSSSSKDDGCCPTPTARRRRRARKKSSCHARRRLSGDNFERDLAVATALVASEMAGARVRPDDVEPERGDIAAGIAAAVLEALTEEAAAELLLPAGGDGAG